MNRFATFAAIIGALLGASATTASAQGFYGAPGYMPYRQAPPTVMPYNPPSAYMPYNQGPVYSQYSAPVYRRMQPAAPQYNPGMGVDLTPIGSYAGALAARGLQAVGVPAPVATWVGGRVNANAESAGREYTPVDAAIRLGGVSMRDIRDYGPLGGPNSEARKVAKFFGF
jgi:hypothetical protein